MSGLPEQGDGDDADFAAGFYGEAFGRFEALGERSVLRLLRSGEIAAQDREAALVWLAGKAREAASARTTAEGEQRAIASSAKDAAWEQAREARRTNTRATIALILAAISALMAAISIVLTFIRH